MIPTKYNLYSTVFLVLIKWHITIPIIYEWIKSFNSKLR